MKSQPYKKLNKAVSPVLVIVLLLLGIFPACAQLNPFQTMYFQNKYIYNPAMAGLEKGLSLDLDYMQQWSSFPGTPRTESFTADFQPVNKVGIGLNVNNDQAGLIKSTRVMGTYAYHLPLSDNNEHLSFGVSLGINDSRVNYNDINGDVTDQELAQYNQLKPYVDGDFGIAYTNNRFYIGSALPNIRSAFFKSSDQRFDADRLLYIVAASYKFPLQAEGGGFVLEPTAAYRVVKGYSNIFDVGFNFAMNNYGIYFQTIYHTSQSMGLGFGLDQHTYGINFSYDLVTSALSNYVNGTFALGLKVKL